MKKLRSILLCIVGVISIGLAIKSYSTKESRYEYNSAYVEMLLQAFRTQRPELQRMYQN